MQNRSFAAVAACVWVVLSAVHAGAQAPVRGVAVGPSLRLAAVTQVVDQGPAVVETVVTLSNVGPRPLAVAWGTCEVLQLRAYRVDAGRAADTVPAWEPARRRNPDPVTGRYSACAGTGRGVRLLPAGSTVPAGASRRVATRGRIDARVPVPALLGDSLPDGVHRFVARVAVDTGDVRDGSAPWPARRAVVVEVQTGAVRLQRRQLPPPAERVVGGALGYRVAADPPVAGVVGPDWRTAPRLVVRNVGRDTARTEYTPCGLVTFLAFRAAADAGDPTKDPVWRERPDTTFPGADGSGAACRYSHTVVLGPGARIEFLRPFLNARDIAGDSLPPGRYFLAAETPGGRVGVGTLDIGGR